MVHLVQQKLPSWCLNDDHRTSININETCMLINTICTFKSNFCSVSLDLWLVIIIIAKVCLVERGLSLCNADVSLLKMSSAQWCSEQLRIPQFQKVKYITYE